MREALNIAPLGHRVHFARRLEGRISLSLLMLALTPFGVEAQPCGVWVVRNALESPEAWQRSLDAVERVGCSRVYLQVSGRWDAYFPSRVFVAPSSAPRGWEDPLAGALAEAHARGLKVHAWVNALLAWSAPDPPVDADHVWRRFPHWFVVRSGRSMRDLSRTELDREGLVGEGWFLDSGREEVRTELRRFLLELATRYPVDGVHLDYIRYPSGWAPAGGADNVTRLVALVRTDLATVRPGAELSVAVMPVPQIAREVFGQDWEAWLGQGLVDAVLPMVYRDSPDAVERVVRAWPAMIPRERVWVGVRIDRLGPAELAETRRRLASAGVAGVALFSHNLLLEDPGWRRRAGGGR